MAATATGRGAARGSWIPWAFVLFFVVITAVNGVMIWYALESWTGLSSGEAYDDGLRYNQIWRPRAARPSSAGSRGSWPIWWAVARRKWSWP